MRPREATPRGDARGEEIDHGMTDKERDPETDGPEGAADDTEFADATNDAEDAEGAEDADDTEEAAADDDAVDDEAAAETAPAAGPGGRRARDRKARPGAPVAAPSVSEQAVHINDRASAVFVFVMIGVFVAIIGYALLFGQGGFASNLLPASTPVVTAAPTAAPTPTAAPSATPAPSPSDAASPSPAAS